MLKTIKKGLGMKFRQYSYVFGALVTFIFLGVGVSYLRQPSIIMHAAIGKSNIVPVAILGSGPAGLTAALYTARANMPTVVITGPDLGGQLTQARYVENWPAKKKESGMELMEQLEEQVRRFGAVLVDASVIKVDFSSWPYKLWLDNDDIIQALSIVIATGGDQEKIDVPGVDTYWGKGIGVCSICDAPFDKDKAVALIGMSDITCDMALQLKEFAKHVYVLVPKDHMEAAAVNVDLLEKIKNISIIYNVELEKLTGNDEKLQEVVYRDTKSGLTKKLAIKSFYFAIGFEPNTTLFKEYIKRDHEGFIIVENCINQTSKPLIYAAGTVIDKEYQKGLISASMGAQAAIQLIESLQTAGFTDQVEQQLKPHLYKQVAIKDELEEVSSLEKLKQTLTQADKAIVLFYGKTCPSCKKIMPLLQTMAQQNDSYRFIKCNIEKDHAVIDTYRIAEIPTVIYFEGGVKKKTLSEDINKESLEALLK